MIAGSPLRLGILGIPFVASVLFFGPGGQSRPYLVVSGGVGPALLYWLAINIDLLTPDRGRGAFGAVSPALAKRISNYTLGVSALPTARSVP